MCYSQKRKITVNKEELLLLSKILKEEDFKKLLKEGALNG